MGNEYHRMMSLRSLGESSATKTSDKGINEFVDVLSRALPLLCKTRAVSINSRHVTGKSHPSPSIIQRYGESSAMKGPIGWPPKPGITMQLQVSTMETNRAQCPLLYTKQPKYKQDEQSIASTPAHGVV